MTKDCESPVCDGTRLCYMYEWRPKDCDVIHMSDDPQGETFGHRRIGQPGQEKSRRQQKDVQRQRSFN